MLDSKRPVMLYKSCPSKLNELRGKAVIGRSEELKELLNSNLEKTNMANKAGIIILFIYHCC